MNYLGVEEHVAGLHRGYWIGAALAALAFAGVYELRSGGCPHRCAPAVRAGSDVASPARTRRRGAVPDSLRQLVRGTFHAEVEGGRDGSLRVNSAACSQVAAEQVIAATRKTDLIEAGFFELVCDQGGPTLPARVELLSDAGRKRLETAHAVERMAHTRGLDLDEVGVSDAGGDGTTLFIISRQCAMPKGGYHLIREALSLAAFGTAPERPSFTSVRCEGGGAIGPIYLTLPLPPQIVL